MKRFRSFLIALLWITPAMAELPTTQPAAVVNSSLGNRFRSRIAGIELNPPAGAVPSSQLASGEIARFVNVQASWDLRIRPVPLHLSKPLTGPDEGGVLELIKSQFTEANPTSEVLRSQVNSDDDICNGAPFGLIEARFDSATDRVFTQQAIFRDNNQYYLIVQMNSHARPKTDTATKPDPQETEAAILFYQVLKTVCILDRSALRKEQDLRLANTHLFWLGLDEKKILAALDPLHFVRIVRDGKDVGFIQMNERKATHNGNPGVEIIIHSRSEADLVQQQDAVRLDPAAVPLKAEKQSYYYTSSSYFVTFDRKHEAWTTTTQLDDQVINQITESANSDLTVRRSLDKRQAAEDARNPTTRRAEPPVLDIPTYTLDVAYAKGPHQEPPTDTKLPKHYLPQTLGQLLPRLLSTEPQNYLFAFYVSGQKTLLQRYVDVGEPREVELDGQQIRAIPISDRIGADGLPTVHYVTKSGEWLGSVTDELKLQMLPTDEPTLKRLWPGFVTTPEPPLETDMPTSHKRAVGDDGFDVQNPRPMSR